MNNKKRNKRYRRKCNKRKNIINYMYEKLECLFYKKFKKYEYPIHPLYHYTDFKGLCGILKDKKYGQQNILILTIKRIL